MAFALAALLVAGLVGGVVVAATVVGRSAAPGVDLQAGWNLVAYSGETLSVVAALNGVDSAVDAVYRWDSGRQAWQSWRRDVPLPDDLIALTRGEAYWVRADAPAHWSFRAEILFSEGLVSVETTAGARHALRVEIADEPRERTRGLMFRQALAADGGMLFLFPGDRSTGFWMQDTYVPLSIAFIDVQGAIVDVLDMDPLTTTRHTPSAPYRWALEVNQGWFAEQGVGVGDRVRVTGE